MDDCSIDKLNIWGGSGPYDCCVRRGRCHRYWSCLELSSLSCREAHRNCPFGLMTTLPCLAC